MLELNIQSIAKWFEEGCASLESTGEPTVSKKESRDSSGFYILECNDICLLSKLADVKSHTLLERAHRQLQEIKETAQRKTFLLTICSEFLRDGRRAVSLRMLTEEIEGQTELFREHPSDLLFHRALCLLKNEQLAEALTDLYLALESSQITSLDKIHVSILEEMKKNLNSQKGKLKEGFIVTKEKGEITFEQILKHYEQEICECIQQTIETEIETEIAASVTSSEQQEKVEEPEIELLQKKALVSNKWARTVCPSFGEKIDPSADTWQCAAIRVEPEETHAPTYKSMLLGFDKQTIEQTAQGSIAGNERKCGTGEGKVLGGGTGQAEPATKEFPALKGNESPSESDSLYKPLSLSYTIDGEKVVRVQQMLGEQVIDNIFNLRAILVGKLAANAQMTTVCEIFETFGTIVNLKFKENTEKLIIEYDNADSPSMAISYLSQLQLPHISPANECLEFRFYKSENQRNLRICKQNQMKSSRECYFWRTTGCQNVQCKFYHNKLSKGVDYQEWMKTQTEQLRALGEGRDATGLDGHQLVAQHMASY